MKNSEKGFTLIELIVVLLMLAVMLATAMTNLFQARKKALLDKDSEKLVNVVRQTKKDSISIREIVNLGASPVPEFNNKFLGYGLRLKIGDPEYYVYEVWSDINRTPAALEDTIELRRRKNTLEWSKIIDIDPVSPQGTVDLRFDKLSGQLVSSEGFTVGGDFVEITLVSKLNNNLQKKIYLSRGGVVSFDPATPVVPTAAP